MFGLKKWFIKHYNAIDPNASANIIPLDRSIHLPKTKETCLDIIDREQEYFWGHFFQYLFTLLMVSFVIFYMMTENTKVIRAAIIVSILLTPQLLRLQYRIRHMNRAVELYGEEKWLDVIYFVDSHYTFQIETPRTTSVSDWVLQSMQSCQWLKKVELTSENTITAMTSWRFLSGSERIEITWKSLATISPETEIRISSYPKSRRQSVDLGKNKINVMLIYYTMLAKNSKALQEESLKSFAPVGIAS